jgi:hypothetical protein
MAYIKQFASEDVRLRTFFRLKGDQHIVRALVDCGFFLENDDKRVCCFHCAIGFEADSTIHDFRAIHLKASPHCTFLKSIISQRERKENECDK